MTTPSRSPRKPSRLLQPDNILKLIPIIVVAWILVESYLNKSNIDWDAVATYDSLTKPSAASESKQACRIVVQNRADGYYDILESIATRFPLKWDTLPNCDYSEPVIVDFALSIDRDKNRKLEQEGWEKYFYNHLQDTVRQRVVDTVSIKFGNIVDSRTYLFTYSAIIDTNCESFKFQRWLSKNPTVAHCVMHSGVCITCKENHLAHMCWTTPMNQHIKSPNSRCHFMPLDLPKPKKKKATSTRGRSSTRDKIKMCVMSATGSHDMLVQSLDILQPDDVELFVHQREAAISPKYYSGSFANATHVHLPDFYDYEQSIASCDILLPLLDPQKHSDYFMRGGRKLAGSVLHILAYKIPTIMHQRLHSIYKDYFDDSMLVETYDSETYSFMKALKTLLQKVREQKRAR